MSDEVNVVTVVCPTCEGRGLITPNVECDRCNGSGQVPESSLAQGEAAPEEAATTPVAGPVDDGNPVSQPQAPVAPAATSVAATPEALAANGPVADPNAAPPVQPPTEPVAPVEEPVADPLAPAPADPASGDDSSVETNPEVNEPVTTPENDQDNGGQSNESNGSTPEPVAPAADPSTTGDPASTGASEPAPVSEPTTATDPADVVTGPNATDASPAGDVTEPNLGADGLPIS